jgi:hypothetical protein
MRTVLIILLVLVLIAVIVIAARITRRRQRTAALRDRFGPEYDDTVAREGSARRAEQDLEERARRRERLDIRELEPAERSHYEEAWAAAQDRFLDQPSLAVREADLLVTEVMRDRGYPMEDFDRRAADISVDHPALVSDYRSAKEISDANDAGTVTTEQMRQAMVHYRALFGELLGSGERSERGDRSVSGRAEDDPPPAARRM